MQIIKKIISQKRVKWWLGESGESREAGKGEERLMGRC
jgi:hypothetical protein